MIEHHHIEIILGSIQCMSRRNTGLTPIDPEIEKTLTQLRRERRKHQANAIEEDTLLNQMADQDPGEVHPILPHEPRSLKIGV